MRRRLVLVCSLPVLAACPALPGAPGADSSSGQASGSSSSSSSTGGFDAGEPRDAGGADAAVDGGPTQSLVVGRVLSPSGSFGVFDAEVTVEVTDATGATYTRSAHSRWDGQYQLRGLGVGIYTFHAVRGQHAGQAQVVVAAPLQQVSNADITIDASQSHYVVVTGAWDTIQAIVGAGGLGFTPTVVTGYDLLGSPTEWLATVADDTYLAGVDAVFLNCGLDDAIWSRPDLMTRLATLRTFVEAGGSLYVSDQAYDLVEALYPDALGFYGNDGFHDVAQEGDAETVTATIVDRTLQKIVGNTVNIEYDLGAWAVMETVDATDGGVTVDTLARGTVHVFGNALPEVPLAVLLHAGQGRIVYTTFHNEAQLDPKVRAILQYMVMSL